MFEIDLLKGQGIPEKRGPETLVAVAVTVAIPIVIGLVMIGCFITDKVAISVRQQQLAVCEKRIENLSGAVELQDLFEGKKKNLDTCFSEVASSIARHSQWTDALMTIAENMPTSMMLTELSVNEKTVKVKRPRPGKPKELVQVSIPTRTLRMDISANSSYSSDRAVREFRDSLRFSKTLGPLLEDIRISQKTGNLNGQNVVLYGIECIFKPQL